MARRARAVLKSSRNTSSPVSRFAGLMPSCARLGMLKAATAASAQHRDAERKVLARALAAPAFNEGLRARRVAACATVCAVTRRTVGTTTVVRSCAERYSVSPPQSPFRNSPQAKRGTKLVFFQLPARLIISHHKIESARSVVKIAGVRSVAVNARLSSDSATRALDAINFVSARRSQEKISHTPKSSREPAWRRPDFSVIHFPRDRGSGNEISGLTQIKSRSCAKCEAKGKY